MTFRLAAAEMTLPGDTLEEKFTFVRKVGFDGIELSARGDGIFGTRVDELRRARDAGVQMPTAVVHMDHFIGDFDADRRRDAIEQLKIFLTTIAAAGGTGIVSPHAFGLFSRRLPPFVPPRSVEDSRAALVEALREVGEHAESVGTHVYLEPLNRFEDFVINQLADAVSVVDEVNSPGIMITADTFHMSIEEANVADSIRAAAARIGHVQLGDTNRLEPGAGHYNWPETLDALESIGYQGWLAMECGLSTSVDEVLPKVAELLSR
ncbi:sugar phosphate isomerase/epimerase family protein [Kribbella sp. NPDC051952]|uniref:sugar phosphate isomerase/epimerase family protein n=1 Tax=Kribbella sp. NPDC051952 TaxID=3154851 RepID=UPI00344464B6